MSLCVTEDDHALVAAARTTLTQRADRGRHDRATIYAIIDQALICHVAFVESDGPVVVPSCPWRIDDWLYVHGAVHSRLLARFASGESLSISIASVDGLVFAHSALRHSLNYRSVILFGRGEPLESREAKATALLALVEKLSPGRSSAVRAPSSRELDATAVARLRIREGSAKIADTRPGRTTPEQSGSVWAGVVPIGLRAGTPFPSAGPAELTAVALPAWLR